MSRRPHRLLFVCTANICRSPMAEGWARALAARSGLPLEARSGGVMGLIGRPADPLAVRVMGEVGVDLNEHRSGGLPAPLLAWADRIVVMELRHQRWVGENAPTEAHKVLQLGSFGGAAEVPDPVGGWRWRFRGSRDLLERCVTGLLSHLDAAGAEDAPPAEAQSPT